MNAIKGSGIKLMAVTLCIILIPLCAFGAQKSGASQPPASGKQVITIIEKPVKVTMKLLDQEDDYYQFELNVVYNKEKFRFENGMVNIKDLNQAISQQRKTAGWKGPYFFIGRIGPDCDTPVRGTPECLDLVFMIKDGQLVYIGEVLSDERNEPSSSYKEWVFQDVYDKFENNDLTSLAGAPTFGLVLEEKDGRFKVNLNRTWEEDTTRKSDVEVILAKDDIGYIREEILYNAILAKYCWRKKELDGLIQAAKSKFDKEYVEKFMKILSQVVPGELPRRSVEVSKERLP